MATPFPMIPVEKTGSSTSLNAINSPFNGEYISVLALFTALGRWLFFLITLFQQQWLM